MAPCARVNIKHERVSHEKLSRELRTPGSCLLPNYSKANLDTPSPLAPFQPPARKNGGGVLFSLENRPKADRTLAHAASACALGAQNTPWPPRWANSWHPQRLSWPTRASGEPLPSSQSLVAPGGEEELDRGPYIIHYEKTNGTVLLVWWKSQVFKYQSVSFEEPCKTILLDRYSRSLALVSVQP